MRHVTRSWQATVLSGSAEYRGAKHTVVDRWLRVSAQKVSLALVDLPDRSHVAVTTRSTLLRRSPAEWITEVRHGRALHGSVQGPHGVAGRAGTVSGQCTWTVRRCTVWRYTSSASLLPEERIAAAGHGRTG